MVRKGREALYVNDFTQRHAALTHSIPPSANSFASFEDDAVIIGQGVGYSLPSSANARELPQIVFARTLYCGHVSSA